MTKTKRFGVTAALFTVLCSSSPAVANADAIDRALNALPAGQISCEQARNYWTNTADYNNKVAQARALALVDPRGPQILAALARVDEAANRCGLKAPAPAAPATPPVAQVINVPVVGAIAVPDLFKMLQNWLAGFGIRI
ncbi:hypothetical protein [Corynebacterium suicordis]|uniref:Secreted protein n=1 Tax=Corynebacterium suicordis DSM 45110 TaxID=1121369 RepID=A0ABR9ZJY2_9CORY|nr:hypothetical protein [Corynebacterium suicordis]MBF4553298.1 hypothetical protein [Corynebacterium suicordis DSM 45110]MDR6277732.1 hypothetical protein [Corynebacterium suicordis]